MWKFPHDCSLIGLPATGLHKKLQPDSQKLYFLARKSSLLLNVFAFALGLNTDLFEKAARPKEKQTALLAGETLFKRELEWNLNTMCL